MHPRLRRQLAAASVGEISPPLRRLLESVEAEYRERDELQESLRALTGLLHKAHSREEETETERSRRQATAARAARKLGRVLDRSRAPVLELSPELLIRRGNEAAAKLCGVPQKQMAGKALFSLLEPMDAETVAARWTW